jgi:hypothetical protein
LATQLQTSFSDLAKIRDEIKADREALARERAEQAAALARERAQMATERAEVAAVVAALNSSQILSPLRSRSRSPATTRTLSSRVSAGSSNEQRRRHERAIRRSLGGSGNNQVNGLPPRQPYTAATVATPAPAPATIPSVTPVVAVTVVPPLAHEVVRPSLPSPPFSPTEPGAPKIVVSAKPSSSPSPTDLLRQINAHVSRNDLPKHTPRVLRSATADDSASGASSSTDARSPALHSHHHTRHHNHQRASVNNDALPASNMTVSRQSSVDSASERGDESPATDDTDDDDLLVQEIEGGDISSASPSPMITPVVLPSISHQQPSPMIMPSLPSISPPVVITAPTTTTTVIGAPSARCDLVASVVDDFVRLDNPSNEVSSRHYAAELARLRAAGHQNDSFNIDMLIVTLPTSNHYP